MEKKAPRCTPPESIVHFQGRSVCQARCVLYVGGVTSTSGALVSSGLSSFTGQSTAGAGGSTFGPAFLMGGSSADYTQGLYNSLGTLLSSGQTRLSSGSPPPSNTATTKRAEALNAAATKLDLGDIEGGRADLERLVDSNGNDVTALHLIAISYMGERDYKQAERYYSRAAALSPDSARLQSDLANARSLQQSDEDVLAEGIRKIKSPAQRTEGLRLLAYLTDRSPQDVEAYLAMADGFEANRDSMAVLGALQEAVKYADDSQIDEVIARAEDLAEQHPDVGLPHNILGRALQKAGRVNEAISELKSASDIAPNNLSYRGDLANAYIQRAGLKLGRGDITSASTDLDTAQVLDPSSAGLDGMYAHVAADRARLRVAAGQYTQALTELTTASSKAPNDPGFKKTLSALYLRVANHFEKEGVVSQALSSFIEAFELDPTSVLAKRKVTELSYTQGMEALGNDNYDEAINNLDRAYQNSRTNDTYRKDLANAYDLRGQHLLSLGKTEDALEDFKAGFALDPSNQSLNTNLSNTLNTVSSS